MDISCRLTPFTQLLFKSSLSRTDPCFKPSFSSLPSQGRLLWAFLGFSSMPNLSSLKGATADFLLPIVDHPKSGHWVMLVAESLPLPILQAHVHGMGTTKKYLLSG